MLVIDHVLCFVSTRNHFCHLFFFLINGTEKVTLLVSQLTVQDDSGQRIVVLVENLPESEGLLWRIGQQPEQQSDGVVRGQPLRMDEPASQDRNRRSR